MPAIRLVRARRNAVAATRRPTVLAKRDQAGLRTTQPLRPTPLHNPRQNTADLILATETAACTRLPIIRRKIFTLSGHIAYRAVLPMEAVPAGLRNRRVTLLKGRYAGYATLGDDQRVWRIIDAKGARKVG